MVTWLVCNACSCLSFGLGAWRSFKLLKQGKADFAQLKFWCVLGTVEVLAGYTEVRVEVLTVLIPSVARSSRLANAAAFACLLQFILSWVPLYHLCKCALLLLITAPDLQIAPAVFHKLVAPGIQALHHSLNHIVWPNVIEFASELPWRILVALFPSLRTSEGEDKNFSLDTSESDRDFSDAEEVSGLAAIRGRSRCGEESVECKICLANAACAWFTGRPMPC